MKNFLLKLLCKLPLRKHPLGESKRILVVSTTGLGDTLWGTPTIESLRKSFPKSYLAILTTSLGKEIFKENPFLDAIYEMKKPLFLSLFSLWKNLYKDRFDTVLVLHASQRLIFPLSARVGARTVIGTKGINKGLDSLFTKALLPKYEHEILRRLRMVEEIGGTIHTENLSLVLKKTESLLQKGNWIALHPGSKDGFKRWPKKNFIALGNALKKKILITGTFDEKELVEQVASEIPGAHSFIIPSIDAFANVLSQVELIVSNDTGTVHLACALNCPVIALYGPTDPNLCGPHKGKATVFKVNTTCSPCIKRKCREPFCLRQIGVDQVLASIPQ